MKLLAYLIYIPLQIIWLPLSLIGVWWTGYKQIYVSRRMGLSQTAIEIINGRWTLDWFGIRADPAARQLARHLPNTSTVGLGLTLFPLWLARRITGADILYPLTPPPAQAGIASLVPSRSEIIDGYIEDALPHAEQFVILGAGLGTRCYNLPDASRHVLFELDRAVMQRFKCVSLDKAAIDRSRVRFVTVDFANKDWMETLKAAGYDREKRSVFLWEGVTLYLSQDAVHATLELIAKHTAKGSMVVLDIYAQRFIKLAQRGAMAKTLELTGEGPKFGLDLSDNAEAVLGAFVQPTGLKLEQITALGTAQKAGAFMAVAMLTV